MYRRKFLKVAGGVAGIAIAELTYQPLEKAYYGIKNSLCNDTAKYELYQQLQKYQNLNPDTEISLATSYEDKINLLNQHRTKIMPYSLNYDLIMQYTESIIPNFVENENVELVLANPKKDPPILTITHYKENKIIIIKPSKLEEKWLLSYEVKRIR